jgi:alkane 1-monooxygenase
MNPWKPFGYLLLFLVPTLPLRANWLAEVAGWPDLAAWYPLIVLFVLVPVLDHLIGIDTRNPADNDEARRLDANPYYRVITLACLPAYLALLAWSAHAMVTLPLSPLGKLAWLYSQGVIGGVVAINVAHEMIHRHNRLEQWAGGALLACVCYAGFKIEHVRGHHVNVSTPGDISSAPFGMNAYAFIARALVGNPRGAWRLEARRLALRGERVFSLHNELFAWYGLSLALLVAFTLAFGLAGALFFLVQSLIAAATLEVINYVEHYGLARRQLSDGRYERTTHLHSWNSSFLLSNLLLLQLQRHSDHHAHAGRRYPSLRHHDDAPQLPAGYPTMFLLALVPPLWFAVMNPRVRAFRERLASASP